MRNIPVCPRRVETRSVGDAPFQAPAAYSERARHRLRIVARLLKMPVPEPGFDAARCAAMLQRLRALPAERQARLRGMVDWVEDFERVEAVMTGPLVTGHPRTGGAGMVHAGRCRGDHDAAHRETAAGSRAGDRAQALAHPAAPVCPAATTTRMAPR